MNLFLRGNSLVVAVLAVVSAACGITSVDPIGGPSPTGSGPNPGTTEAKPATTLNPPQDPTPPTAKRPTAKQPVGPYTGAVETTDVSILYPLSSGTRTDYVGPGESGDYGVLFPRSVFERANNGLPLDTVERVPPSGWTELAVVGVRLDPCSRRKGATSCTSEVRIVLQALDLVGGAARATDGAVHVTYDVPEADLVTMMKQILTLKKANGDLALLDLAPHPILANQGLVGPFAKGLRAVLLEHLGANRMARVTIFDHNFGPDRDGWNFTIHERSGATFVRKTIPAFPPAQHLLSGTSATDAVPLASADAHFWGGALGDDVQPLTDTKRPPVGSPNVSTLRPAYEAALRLQNPTIHDSESTNCISCHLAEGASRMAESHYGFTSTNAFNHTRSLARVDQRTSITNLHAFGYLGTQVSIMQRTANESVVAAEQMEAKVK
jgi:hypothetical protein